MSQKKETVLVFKLVVQTELRFEVEAKSQVTIELKYGLAEFFGTELVKGKKYNFTSGYTGSIFTWHGCTLELVGKTEFAYIGKDTPMVMHSNIHAALEQMRQKAEDENTRGPKVLVAGSTGVGKNTLSRILLNYAVRQGRKPMFVDLDVGQGRISVPGTIGALLVEMTADVEKGFSQLAPLVYHYGHQSPGNNIKLYETLVSRMAEVTKRRKNGVSGTIVNTCGWVNGDGCRSITHAASAFEVDVILVIDQEQLYSELVHHMPQCCKVVFIPKSGGVVRRNQSSRDKARDNRVRNYFYGLKTSLYPHSFNVKFSEMKVYKIGARSLPDSCMPFGMKAEFNGTKVMPVKIGPNLLHYILSVSFAESVEDDIIQKNVAGFICVTNVDVHRQVVTVLSPQPMPLKKSVLLIGDIQFMDSH